MAGHHLRRRTAAYAVHGLTASGIAFMFLAAAEMTRPEVSPRRVFLWFVLATLVDAIDGPLARLAQTKRYAHNVSGRTIDDLVDYLGFAFLPLMLIWRMGWLPGGGVGATVTVLAMMASLIGFAHRHAKDEEAGFFRGFPSYWNIIALYAGLAATGMGAAGPWFNAVLLLALAAMTVSPVWLIYPNLAPLKWKPLVLYGSYAWALMLLAMLPYYPASVPSWAVLVSLVYPAFYLALSLTLMPQWPKHEPFRDDADPAVEG